MLIQKVSIILPCFNGARWLNMAIESVLAQTNENFELLVIDDGSTDASRKIVFSYLHDKRIHYVYQSNQGFSAALNRGIKESCGDVIGFIGQDDLWLPNKLEIQIEFLNEQEDIDLVYSNYYAINSCGQVLWEIRSKSPDFRSRQLLIRSLFLSNFMGFETVLLKRKCFEVGLFDECMLAFSDHDMWLRIADHFNIGYLDKALVKKREHESQLSKVGLASGLRDEFLLVEKAIGRYPFLKSVKKKKLASLHYSLGIVILRAGDLKKAKQELIKSFKCQPWAFKAIGVSLAPNLYLFLIEKYKKIKLLCR